MENNRVTELINDIYAKEAELDKLTALKAETDGKIKALKEELEKAKNELLPLVPIDSNIPVYSETNANVLAVRRYQKNIAYLDEPAMVSWLKENGYDKFIKTTEALDKNPLKKEMKVNESLKSALEPYVYEKTSVSVIVTNAASYKKMLEHMEK